MIYPQRDSRRRRKKFSIWSGIFFAVVALILLVSFWKPNVFSPAVHFLGRPFVALHDVVNGSFGFVGSLFADKRSLVAENQNLKQIDVLYQAVTEERDYYQQQNMLLSRIVPAATSSRVVATARVISKPSFSPYDTVIIEGGTDNGIRIGDYVLADDVTLLGMVVEAYGQTSIVDLLSSPDEETKVLIGDKSIQAVATGKGSGDFELKLPRNVDVNNGDVVVAASTTPARIMGTIQNIVVSPDDSFEKIVFKSPVDISELSYVLIEK